MPSVVMKTLLRDQEVQRVAESQSEVLAAFQSATKVVRSMTSEGLRWAPSKGAGIKI